MMDSTESPVVQRSRAPMVAVCLFIVIAAWAALQLWGLGETPFHTKGEPREGLVVWEMTHRGGWILPKRNGDELPSKPPLFHWLGAATSLLHGDTDEWSVRLPSAVLSLLGLLCVLAAGTMLWSPRAGLFSALVLMTMFEWARAATGARVDMTLTFGLQLALLGLLFFLRAPAPAWLIPLYAGITLAVLGKGPVGVVLPGLVVLIMLGLTRRFGTLKQMRLGSGALLVGLVAGSWYVLALLFGGFDFFRKQILAENVFTFLDNPEFIGGAGGHRHAALYLAGAVILGLLPWTVFLPGVAARLWRQRRGLSLHDARSYLLVWITVVFSFYAVAASKRSVYLLALYPAVALLLGWWWDERTQAPPEEDRWLARFLLCVCWPVLGVLGITLAFVGVESVGAPLCAMVQRWLPPPAQFPAPWISDTIRTGRWPLLILLAAAVVSFYGCIRAVRAAHWTAVFAAVFCAIAALMLSVTQVFLPGIARHQTQRAFMADVRQVVGPAERLSFYRVFDYGAVFYWRDHIPRCAGPWPASGPRYLLMAREEWERSRSSAGGQYERVTLPHDPEPAEPGRLVLIRRTAQ